MTDRPVPGWGRLGQGTMTPMTTPAEVIRQAEQKYLYDAEFHARVEHAVRALSLDLHERTGRYIDGNDRSVATLAASVGLLMAKADPVTGLVADG